MTLKCWTSNSAIGQPSSADNASGGATTAAATATSGASSSSGSAMPPTMTILAPGPRSAPSTATSISGQNQHQNHHHHHPHHPHPHTGLMDMRRRSVGFINTSSIPESAVSPLVTTPSRNPNVHKPNNRMRSMSSTWEATDIDDDDDAAEEKTSSSYSEINRRELMFTQIASSLNQQSSMGNQIDGLHTPRRRGHNSRSARSRRRRTMSESSGSVTSNASRRVRILTPVASKICFGGWVRGQPAEVRWEAVDKSVQSVRIDVCNVAWSVPTTIATRVPNDGNFQWKRVYWGMPITDGYYVNIYDVTDVSPEQLPSPDQQPSRPLDQPPRSENQSQNHHQNDTSQAPRQGDKVELVLLARSDCFAVIG